jgi:hypothetical protein
MNWLSVSFTVQTESVLCEVLICVLALDDKTHFKILCDLVQREGTWYAEPETRFAFPISYSCAPGSHSKRFENWLQRGGRDLLRESRDSCALQVTGPYCPPLKATLAPKCQVSRKLLQKLIVLQLLKNFPTFYVIGIASVF